MNSNQRWHRVSALGLCLGALAAPALAQTPPNLLTNAGFEDNPLPALVCGNNYPNPSHSGSCSAAARPTSSRSTVAPTATTATAAPRLTPRTRRKAPGSITLICWRPARSTKPSPCPLALAAARRPHRQFLGLLLEPRWQQLWFRAHRHRVRCRRRRRGVGCGQHNAWRSQLPVVDTSERRRAPDAWEHVLLRRVHDRSHQLRPGLGHAQRLSGGIDAHRCAGK